MKPITKVRAPTVRRTDLSSGLLRKPEYGASARAASAPTAKQAHELSKALAANIYQKRDEERLQLESAPAAKQTELDPQTIYQNRDTHDGSAHE